MTHPRMLAAAIAASLAALGATPAHCADARSAEALLEKSNCFNCHSVEKAKEGPAYREVAKKYRGKPEAVDKLYKHATTRPIVKVDGKEEEHATLKSKNPAEIRNVIEWILSL